MLLIADLVKLIGTCSQTELQKVLQGLGVAVKFKSLTKYLYLLVQLQLIVRREFGNVAYYLPREGAPEYIRYAPKDQTMPVDRLRLSAMLRKDFPST